MELLPVDAVVRTLLELHYSEWLLLIAISITSVVLLRKTVIVHWPPGPLAWPIVGHLHLLDQLPHHSVCKLAQTYGPLMGLRLGGVPVIVASSPLMEREILKTYDAALAYRPRTAVTLHLCFDSSDVAFAPVGPYWKFLRQVYATELFSPNKMESFRHVREGEVRGLMQAVLRRGGERGCLVEVRGSLVTASNNINCMMVMGKKLDDMISGVAWNEVGSLHSLIEDLMHLMGVFYLGDYVPWLAWLDSHGYLKRMKATAQRTRALLQCVIDERRQ
ncbi:hypothetical protein GOP47_0007936 [Adiantum capillus-veneris]|uniref:Uncharacterized protein n=1 Tax=Adiantum capillus-veneris TaxID=13818 RepID=A0A9D4ZLF1_ADICA|nr:hypothetical protein GOP47_0007936 [Adiantum capillus-veneris]